MTEHAFPQPLLDLLGFVRMLEPDGDWCCMEFEARQAHTHSSGKTVQGGILTAWMDHAMARAVVARDQKSLISSLEIKTAFMSRVGPGTHLVRARGARWGRKVAFLEAEVCGADGRVLASATSTGLLLGGMSTP